MYYSINIMNRIYDVVVIVFQSGIVVHKLDDTDILAVRQQTTVI